MAAAAEADKPEYETATVVRHLAHEVRQPLSTIESIAFYLEMVLPRTEGKARRQLNKLQQELHHVNWILSDAIHFLGAVPLRTHLADLSEVVSRSLSEWDTRQGAPINLMLEDDLPLVQLDLEQAQHMLRNIVAFFGRISAQDRTVLLRTYSDCGSVVLEVEARGIECAPEELAPIFEPFDENLPSGTGLALASARKIAEAHGARIETSQDGPGEMRLAVFFPAC